jgi:hypothetical protein
MECGEVTVYKIRCRATGLYSLGRTIPRWNKTGKVWKRIGDLRNHLSLVADDWNGKRELPAEWEVVEYELVESRTVSAREF